MIWISVSDILIIAVVAAFAGVLCGVYIMTLGNKPTKPTVVQVVGEPDEYECGECGEYVGDELHHFKHCPECRTKVDWSDIDD